jgi:nucleoside-diphosphate-sugar epimerase
MKVLVTGGTGFTGKALTRRLLDGGHEVIALDYKEGLKTEELREWGATVVIGSVTDRDILHQCMPGIDVVQHAAAAFREMNVDDAYYRKVNVEGTRNVLQIALENGVKKVIYFSTCGVHGNVNHPPAAEDAPIQPADYYQRTKYEAEPIVQEYVRKGLRALILRPAAIYGPGDPERFAMIFKRVAGGKFPMFGSGRTLYHPVYIDNLIDAAILAMESDRGDGEAYLIADEEYVEIERLVRGIADALQVDLKMPHYPVMPLVVVGHIVEKLCKPFGVTPPIFPRRVDWYRQNRAFDIGKAKRDLGYQPRVGLRDGLEQTAAWYRENGYIQDRTRPGRAAP